jgi:hypothetical protein
MSKFKIAFMKQPVVDSSDKTLLLSQMVALMSYVSLILY